MMQNKNCMAVLIIAITLVLMVGFQMRQVLTERTQIKQAFANQEKPLADIKQVSAQFESLAVGTARLAGEGNDVAKNIIASLAKIGVQVNPNASEGQKGVEFKKPEEPAAPTTTPSAPAAPAAPARVGN